MTGVTNAVTLQLSVPGGGAGLDLGVRRPDAADRDSVKDGRE